MKNKMTPEFEAKFNSFVAGCQEICDNYMTINFPNNKPMTLEVESGSRYMRVVRRGESIHCFVDKTNGDVLKPASYRIPAKHARGNIMDEHNGLSWMSAFGPAYLQSGRR